MKDIPESTSPHSLVAGGVLCFWEAVCDVLIVGEIMADIGCLGKK